MASVDITLQQLYDMIKGGAVGVPVGTIVDYYGTTAPNGWLICDGREVPTSMSQLRSLIGSKTPDLRGRFRRMIGGNAAGMGVAQDQNTGAHNHRYKRYVGYASGDAGNAPVTQDGNGPQTRYTWDTTENSGDGENRPVNMAFNAIIYGGGVIVNLLNRMFEVML